MRRSILLFVVLGLCAGLGLLFVPTASAQTRIVYVSAERIIPPSGPEVFEAYCASCHGVAGRGNGPAAALLKAPVPNLTLIAVRDGTFGRNHVVSHIRGDAVMNPMPEWHRIIRDTYGSDGAEHLAVVNLTRYVETIQVKR